MKEIVGKKYGRQTVIDSIAKNNRTEYVRCRCECGNEKDVYFYNLISGKSKSCGCVKFGKHTGKIRIDMLGKTFGEQTVLERAPDECGQLYYLCQCSCGETRSVNACRLRDGSSISCGHQKSPDLSGSKFGHQTAIEKLSRVRPNGHKCSTYKCLCDCGTERIVDAYALKTGKSTSCGCVNSKGQEQIIQYLNTRNIRYQTEVWFHDLIGTKKPLRFDFSLNNSDGSIICLIEFNGKQHYESSGNESFGKLQRDLTDSLKLNYCKEKEIPLYIIKYSDNIEKVMTEIIDKLHENPVPSSS